MKKLVFIIPLIATSLLASCGSKSVTYHVVSFNTGGGSFIKPLHVEDGKTIDKPTDPVKANMTFYDWYTNERFEGEPYDFNTPINSELVLYARWGYKVTFYCDTIIYKEQVTPESTLVEPPPTPPSIEYHDFKGWYTDPSCEEEYLYNFDKVIESNLSLYSNYTPEEYDIIYHDLLPDDINPNPNSYIYGVGIDELKDATRNGYTFVGWFTDSGHTMSITSISTLAHGTIDLYAKFTDEYKITYPNWPGGVPNPNPNEYSSQDDTITLNTHVFDDEKYVGLHFKGYLDENKEPITEIPGGSSGDKIIYLDYDADEVTIDFDANGGYLNPGTFNNVYLNYCQEDTENVEITNVPITIDSKPGYNPNTADYLDRNDDKYFAGWYLDENYTQPLVESDSTVNELQPGATLYAKWNKKRSDYLIANKQGVTKSIKGSTNRSIPVMETFCAHIPFYASKIDLNVYQKTRKENMSDLKIRCVADDLDGSYGKDLFTITDTSMRSYNFNTSTTLEKSDGGSFVVDNCSISYMVQVAPVSPFESTTTYEAGATFKVSEDSYRNQLIKVKSDKGSKKVKYWDLVNAGNPIRAGYNFVGWSIDGVTPIDLGERYQFTTDMQLKALWKQLI